MPPPHGECVRRRVEDRLPGRGPRRGETAFLMVHTPTEQQQHAQEEQYGFPCRYLLRDLEFASLIDIGCGDGRFLAERKTRYPLVELCQSITHHDVQELEAIIPPTRKTGCERERCSLPPAQATPTALSEDTMTKSAAI